MTTVKLSYSILSAWAHPMRQEQAVGMYLGQPLPATPEMELGKLKHEIWANEIEKDRTKLPDELGGTKLNDPVIEQKYQKIIPLTEDIQILLRGMPDCTDGDTIYEFKCGKGEPGMYVDSLQLDYYKLFYPQAKQGIYNCHNPYTKELRRGWKNLDRDNAEAALEHVITFGSEMINYLQAEKLLINYKEGK